MDMLETIRDGSANDLRDTDLGIPKSGPAALLFGRKPHTRDQDQTRSNRSFKDTK